MTRFVDVLFATLGLLTLSPFLLVLAALVRLTSPGPALYRAQRVGKNGRLFRLYKFRSMMIEAAHLGPGLTTAGDNRITPVGRWLRRFKFDELPQLVNILIGDMSLVGPRPEDPRYVAHYTPEQRRVLAVRPGLTSPASVRYRAEETLLAGADWEAVYLQQILPDKLRLELEYLQTRTAFSDLKILWQTALAVFR
jgi:lipopolysaccharide/colanic/teichoic acid biosynthesis glycosyltransferase